MPDIPNDQGGLVGLVNQLQQTFGIQDWSKEAAASQNLAGQPGGSIMANYQPKPQWRQDSPLLDTILSGLGSLLDPNTLLQNIGGPSQAILGPIRTGAQRQVVKGIGRLNPEILRAVENDPRMLQIFTPGQGKMSEASTAKLFDPILKDAYAYYRPSATMPSGGMVAGPELLRGDKGAALANVPQVAGHEATHFLNDPRIRKASDTLPEVEIKKMIDTLSPYLSEPARRGVAKGVERTGQQSVGLDEALAYLTSPGTRNPRTEDIGKILNDMLQVRAGAKKGQQLAPTLSPAVVDLAVQMATEQSPLNRGVLDYITSVFGGGR